MLRTISAAIHWFFTAKPAPKLAPTEWRTRTARTTLIRRMHGERFVIHYGNGAGSETVRTVRLQQLRKTDRGDLILVCYCELRKGLRHFRLDRVIAVADCDGVLQEPMAAFWHRTLDVQTSNAGYNAAQTQSAPHG